MDEEITLPPRLITLGVAMRPLLANLEQALAEPVTSKIPVLSMRDALAARIDALPPAILRLESRVNALMTNVVNDEAAGDAEIYRAVGRLEGSIDEFLMAYREVREMNTHGNDSVARDQLAGIYRHSLNEIRHWLADLVESLANPRSALERRGLPLSGEVELTFTLKLTSAPQLPRVVDWMKNQIQDEYGLQVLDEPAQTFNPREPYRPGRVNGSKPSPASAHDLLEWAGIILVAVVMVNLSFVEVMLLWFGASMLSLIVWLSSRR